MDRPLYIVITIVDSMASPKKNGDQMFANSQGWYECDANKFEQAYRILVANMGPVSWHETCNNAKEALKNMLMQLGYRSERKIVVYGDKTVKTPYQRNCVREIRRYAEAIYRDHSELMSS